MVRRVVAIALLAVVPAAAVDWGKLRRVAVGAACAASAADTVTTFRALGRGAREGNPLFARRDGVNAPVMIGAKAGACAALAVIGRKVDKKPGANRALSIAAAGQAAFLGAVAVRNTRVGR